MRATRSPRITGHFLLALVAMGAAVALGCDGDSTSTTSNTGGSTGGTGGATGGTGGSTGGTTTGGTGGDTGGATTGGGGTGGTTTMTDPLCEETAAGPTRGSAIALSKADDVLVSVNRDVGSVTVMSVDYADGDPKMTKTAELDLGKDSEPWQVAMDACGDRAYVVTRKGQKVVELRDLKTAPKIGKSVDVGSEPTGIAISPNNGTLWVTNWVDGTVMKIAAQTMTVSKLIDLNKPLVDTGFLGAVEPRPALAHPRAIAITNNGDADDDDETIVVTEWFAVRIQPEGQNGVNADTAKSGLVYTFKASTGEPSVLPLPPVGNTGIVDHNNAITGCYPNQVSSVTIKDNLAYVTSTCASPKGPVGVFNGKNGGGACTVATEANDCGAVGGSCDAVTLKCKPNTTDVTTTTHPALSIVNLGDGSASTTTLDAKFNSLENAFAKRMPLLPTDLDFVNDFAYISAMGTDAVFRVQITNGAVGTVGSASNNFINLRTNANDKLIRAPIGIVTAHQQANGFVANDGSRDITAIEFNAQAIAGNQTDDFRI
ncbi:MAG: hypothetical protein R3F14_36055, partial [Polyangiaceae bacterium]